jgi:hypothetical protein
MSQLGRIGGQVLTDNLLRAGTNLAFENNLLYLDVNTKTISINFGSAGKDLFVNQSVSTENLIVDNLLSADNIRVQHPNTLSTLTGSLIFSAANGTTTNNVQTDDLNIIQNTISTRFPNTSLQISATGTMEVYADVNVTGSIYASGDISADGNITFGNENSDTVVFNADVQSDLIPNITDIYFLGSPSKRWREFNISNVISDTVSIQTLTANGVDPALRPGKIWFVSPVSGSNSHAGDHENGPFLTLKHALSVATSGDSIYLYPGDYVEIFPLTVPTGVSIKGHSLRSVTVKPTLSTNTQNAFLLNGETVINDITVSGFYQGYAFSFAPEAQTTTRSPYVQNVSVITRGSVITNSDPLGFDSGDAGRGALVDGSVCDSNTLEAAMLFHSVTFITPGVDALTMTNGVRVEWLNSFTYFANRSLYATNGSLGQASLGTKFGAEVRAIASASVYGNCGAWADGDSTLMYLIQYNFGYIGSGKDSSNDKTLINQSCEVTELNNGKIYYQSVDQSGNFRVGNEFYVDFDQGSTSIDVSQGNITGLSSLTINTGNSSTYIDSTKMETGNFVLRDNTLLTSTGPFNIVSASEENFLTQNVLIQKNLAIVGNIKIDGTLTLGNQTSDTVDLSADVDSNLILRVSLLYTLGNSSTRWLNAYLQISNIGDVVISSNEITSVENNQALILSANNVGIISIPSNAIVIANTLTVNDVTTTANLELSSDSIQVGDYNQTGNALRIGNTELIGTLTITDDIQFTDIKISNNLIETTVGNNNLILASSSDKIIMLNDVLLDKNLTVHGVTQADVVQVVNTIVSDKFTTGNVLIDDNFITTTVTNSNLELQANGTGKVQVPLKNVEIVNNLTVNGLTELQTTLIAGQLTHEGARAQTGNYLQTGNFEITEKLTVDTDAVFPKIKFVNNNISTSVTGEDLILSSAGLGKIYVPADNVRIDKKLTVSGTTSTANINAVGTITADRFTNSNILIDDNFITTLLNNDNLELTANGLGNVLLEQIRINNNILSTQANRNIVLTPGTLKNLLINSSLALKVPVGTAVNRPVGITGDLRFSTPDNVFGGWSTARRSFGGVYSADRRTLATAHPTNNSISFIANNIPTLDVLTNKLRLNGLLVDNQMLLNNNTILNTTPDSDFLLNPSSEIVVINETSITDNLFINNLNSPFTISHTSDGYLKFTGTGAVSVSAGTELEKPTVVEIGMTRFNTDLDYMEIYNGVKWIPIVGEIETATLEEISEIGDLWSLILG